MSESNLPAVLVVEDDEDLLRMVYKVLEPIASVATASDGKEALDLLQSGWTPNLIISDIMMPHMDGLTMATAIKTMPALNRVPIIFLTARTSPKDVMAGINAGAKFYITKPFKHDELLTKVKKALGKK